ncbi:Fic family protein [Candidatus Micrarchaeota archaeon]|nr:Fic family protein [Candidatus Micrarchaeota archaeon]
MAYIEKKLINGKEYYYLTTSTRVGKNKWKKTRRYLGLTPHGTTTKKQIFKTILSKQQHKILDLIKFGYSKKYPIGKALWQIERERIVSFIFNTNAIEGNTLTYEETDSVLRGKTPSNARKKDVREVKNMKKCIDFLFDYTGEIDEKTVLHLNLLEMDGVLPDAGHYRNVNVRVGNYFPPIFQAIPNKMAEFFEWYKKASVNLNSFELAALVHLKFVKVHPFRDGNGRMSRLLMNFVLLKHGYPLLNIFDAEKMLYYLVLRKVDSTKKAKPFIDYLFQVYASQYKEFI